MKPAHFIGASIVSLLIILGVMYPISGFRDLSSSLVAWGTLMLAIATFVLVQSIIKQERNRRKDELSKEQRSRDIALLNEIIEWGIDIVKIGTPAQSIILVSSLGEESERRLIQNTLLTLNNDFRVSIAVSLYISRIALAFGGKLQNSIDTLDKATRKQGDLIEVCIEIVHRRATSEFDKAWDTLIANWDELGVSASNVIDEATIEKLTILNI